MAGVIAPMIYSCGGSRNFRSRGRDIKGGGVSGYCYIKGEISVDLGGITTDG